MGLSTMRQMSIVRKTTRVNNSCIYISYGMRRLDDNVDSGASGLQASGLDFGFLLFFDRKALSSLPPRGPHCF